MPYVPYSGARRWPAAYLADAAAHMVAGDENDAFNQAIVDFIARNARV